MISAGNDIVSLVSVNIPRTQQPAFYNKILADTEIDLYEQAYAGIISFANYVWLLWSVKEAAYKYLQRFDTGLVFSPTKFMVSDLCKPVQAFNLDFKAAQLEGTGFDEQTAWACNVSYGSEKVYSRSILYPNLIHSVVNGTRDFNKVYWGIKTIADADPEQQSAAVRDFLVNKARIVFNNDELQAGKSKSGLPVISDGSEEMALSVSLSHHELFVAYSFALQ
jgi:phosphopantetheinyl transferase (holo-ACP synthase)